MTRIIKPQYFTDQQEQSAIKIAVLQAIPGDVKYSNLVQALLTLALEFARDEVSDEWYGKTKP